MSVLPTVLPTRSALLCWHSVLSAQFVRTCLRSSFVRVRAVVSLLQSCTFGRALTRVLLLALFLLLSYSNQRSVLIAGVDRGPVDARCGFAQPFCGHHGSRDFVCPCHHHLLPGDQQAPLHRQWRRASLLPHPLPRPVWNVYKLERVEC